MKQAEITIDYLANHKELVPQLATWSWQQWTWIYRQRGQTFEHALQNYEERAQTASLPVALVALAKTKPIGTASLKEQDLEIRPAMTPCLGGVFVVPEWRKRGVASALLRAAAAEGERLGFTELYLWTESPAAESLYLKMGWDVIERIDYAGTPIVTMSVRLGAQDQT